MDRLAEYNLEEISEAVKVVNPNYRKLDGEVRKKVGLLNRKLGSFGSIRIEEGIETAKLEEYQKRKSILQEEILVFQKEIEGLKKKRKETERHIQITDEEDRWIERVLKAIERSKLSTSKLSAIPNPATSTEDPHGENLISQETKPTLIQVDPTKISHQHTTELGPELVIMHAWKVLHIDSLLKSLGFGDRHAELALLSVANRLVDPRSEHALPAWVETSSFPDLCHHIPKNLIDDQFYRVADMLFKHKVQIEATLAETERSLFSLKRTLYLYDTSNTYFEGKIENNPKAKRSKNSKEKRTDAKLIAFGLVLDEDGFVIKHENFPGNMHDSATLQKMIKLLERDIFSLEKPMIVMDSGFSGEKNLKMLRDKGYDYIVTGRRPTRTAYEDDFSNAKFKLVTGRESKEPVSVAFKDEENERILLCHSEARGEKEKAILSNAEKSFLKDLQNLSKRLQKKYFNLNLQKLCCTTLCNIEKRL